MRLIVLRWMIVASIIHSAQAENRVELDELPSLEFLDYLGSLVETNGELIGPEIFQETKIIRDEPIVPDAAREEEIDRD